MPQEREEDSKCRRKKERTSEWVLSGRIERNDDIGREREKQLRMVRVCVIE